MHDTLHSLRRCLRLIPSITILALTGVLVVPLASSSVHADPGDGLDWTFAGVCSPSAAGVKVASTDGQDHTVTLVVAQMGSVGFSTIVVPADGSTTSPTINVPTDAVIDISLYDGVYPGDGVLLGTFHGYVPELGPDCLTELSTVPIGVGVMALHCAEPVYLSAYLYVSTPGPYRRYTIQFLQDGVPVVSDTSQTQWGGVTYTHDVTEPGTYAIVVLDDRFLPLASFGPVEVDPTQPDCVPVSSPPEDTPEEDGPVEDGGDVNPWGTPEAGASPEAEPDLPTTGAEGRLAAVAATLLCLGLVALRVARRPVRQ